LSASFSKKVRQGLKTQIVGREIHAHKLVVSTNDVIWELADRGAAEGTVVFADEQTRGRGRLGRTWWSPRGQGIWMSVLLRPPARGGSVPMTTVVGALAVADAILAETRLPARIRWPNDVILDGKKVAGVLVEARERPAGRELVLGIGINVLGGQSDMPSEFAGLATSLSEAAGREIERTAIARALLRELDRWYQIKLEGNADAVNERWRELSATLGSRIVLEEQGRRYEGDVIDVDVRLGLALRLSRGTIRNFRGEHVSVLRHG